MGSPSRRQGRSEISLMGRPDVPGVTAGPGQESVTKPVILELGCGSRKRHPGSIGIDAVAYEGVDVVADATDALRTFPPMSVDFITSTHFLEHVADVGRLLDEIIRVVRVGGRVEAIVPHFA